MLSSGCDPPPPPPPIPVWPSLWRSESGPLHWRGWAAPSWGWQVSSIQGPCWELPHSWWALGQTWSFRWLSEVEKMEIVIIIPSSDIPLATLVVQLNQLIQYGVENPALLAFNSSLAGWCWPLFIFLSVKSGNWYSAQVSPFLLTELHLQSRVPYSKYLLRLYYQWWNCGISSQTAIKKPRKNNNKKAFY